MIEGMFVFLVGAVYGVAATKFYMKQVHKETQDTLFDPKNYLTLDGKYFTNKSLNDEGEK